MDGLGEFIAKIPPQAGSGLTFLVIVLGYMFWQRAPDMLAKMLPELFKGKHERREDAALIAERRNSALDARAALIVQRQDDKIDELEARIDRLEREKMHLFRQLIEMRTLITMDRNTMDNVCARSVLPKPDWKSIPEISELPKDEK